MTDLIGYWTVVSLYSYLLLFVPVCAMIVVGELVINWASRGRISCSSACTNWLDKKGYGEIFGCSLAMSLVVLGITTLYLLITWAATDLDVSYVSVVNDSALWLIPFSSWVAPVVVGLAGSAIVLRKIFDTFFCVKDKLDKLEKAND